MSSYLKVNHDRHEAGETYAEKIDIKPSRKGLLHKKLDVPQGEPIPEGKLEKAAHSKSPAERKEANFAINAKGFNHKKKKK